MVASWTRSLRSAAMLAVGIGVFSTGPPADARGPLTDDPDSMFLKQAEESGVDYVTVISGVDDGALEKLLEAASQLEGLEDRPPPSLVALERRVRSDVERLQKVLRSEGYYGARITFDIDADAQPVAVSLGIDKGERYTLARFTVRYVETGSEADDLPVDPSAMGATIGAPGRAEMVTSARRRLLESLGDMGRPFAEVVDQSVLVDHADSTMSVTLDVIPGELARFGPVDVADAVDVEPDYIESFVPWKEGETYDRRKVNELRKRLLETGLFASVAIERSKSPTPDGELPITVRVDERKHRSIALAGRWSTDQGFSVEGQWEHRNLFGRGELLSLSAEIGEIKQEFAAAYVKPRFLRRDQDLLLDAALAHEDFDAYEGPLTRYFAGIQRQINENWRVVAGVPIEFSKLTDLQGSRKFSLFGLEARGERDTSNDRLDPNDGSRLRLSLTPWYGTGENRVNFVTGRFAIAGYHAVDAAERYTLAGRARLGSTVGESTETLPANKRFYAGGGASIRGYRFQSVGPLGPDNTPLGGRSLLEVSAELRARITESLGGAVFIDAGNVYDDEVPDLSTNLQWAIGFGVRYFTNFGPIRLDFGFPLNGRDGVDDTMQFYISIGQAF